MPCLFLGYPSNHSRYRCPAPHSSNIHIAVQVFFFFLWTCVSFSLSCITYRCKQRPPFVSSIKLHYCRPSQLLDLPLPVRPSLSIVPSPNVSTELVRLPSDLIVANTSSSSSIPVGTTAFREHRMVLLPTGTLRCLASTLLPNRWLLISRNPGHLFVLSGILIGLMLCVRNIGHLSLITLGT